MTLPVLLMQLLRKSRFCKRNTVGTMFTRARSKEAEFMVSPLDVNPTLSLGTECWVIRPAGTERKGSPSESSANQAITGYGLGLLVLFFALGIC